MTGDGHDKTPMPDMSAEEAAEVLHVNREVVEVLRWMGRLEARNRDDFGWRYAATTVYRVRAEDLTHKMTATAKENCPELLEEIQALALVQYRRGHLDATERIGEALLGLRYSAVSHRES